MSAHPAAARLAALAGLLTLAVPAAAQPLGPGYAPGPCARPAPCRPLGRPLARPYPGRGFGPPPALISGYLPRPNSLPMYNEPPARLPRY